MKNLFILKKRWLVILASLLFGVSAFATQIPIPSTPADSLERFLENHLDMYANGDTILLVDASYVVSGTADLYHGVTIMGDPGLSDPPMVQFLDNGFRLKQDSTSVIIKGLYLNGFNDDKSHRAKFILRMDNIPITDSIFYVMKVEDVEAVGFGGGIDLHQQKHAQYDSVIVNNVIWHDFSGEYCVDPNINFSGYLSITNSTFYDITHGFVKNPDFSSDKNNYTVIPKTFVIDHNTIYNLGGSNNALVQINDPKDSTVTLTFTNNIVQKLYDPTNVRPFRINESAGTFDFDYNVFYDFIPTEESRMQYSLDSTVKNQTNVTSTNEINNDPQLLDVGDFRLPKGSALFTADSEGGQIGDPRWGEFEGVYVYEPEEIVYTNAPVQLEAAIVLVSGDTVLNWTVETFYDDTRGTATIVDTSGVLTPTVAGKVKVTATSVENGAFYDTLIVTIQDSIHVTAIDVHAETTTIVEEDGDLDIIASLTPNNPTDSRIEWSVSDDRIAEINRVSNDTVMELVAKSNGVVTVTAKSLDSGLESTLDITVAIPGVVAHWKLDETAGTTVADEKYFSDGTVINGTDALWVAGKDGNAFDFGSGVDSTLIEVADSDIIEFDSLTSFSLSALVKIADIALPADRNILFKGHTNNAVSGHWYGFNFKNNDLRFGIDDAVVKTQVDFIGANNYMHLGDGYDHIVCIRDVAQDSVFIYLNGEKMVSKLDETGDIRNDLALVIGNNPEHNGVFPGIIDDVIFYNIALSAQDVAAKTAEYGITAIVPPSDDATLSDLQVDGSTIDGFTSATTAYDVLLPAGTITIPTVTATTTHANASAVVTDATALPGSTTVEVTAEDGSSKLTYTIAFTVPPVVDGIENVNSSDLRVYPNPANDFISINVTQQAAVTIHNLLGDKVMDEIIEDGGSIDIQELADGVYIINVLIEDQVNTFRFVKD